MRLFAIYMLKGIGETVWDMLKVIGETLWNMLKVIGETLWNMLKVIGETVWNILKELVTETKSARQLKTEIHNYQYLLRIY